MTLDGEKAAARKVAFAARKAAHGLVCGPCTAMLSKALAGYRGTPLAGYMPIRTEIDPRPVMAEMAEHGEVGVPVVMGEGLSLMFSRWRPDGPLREGPFGAQVPEVDDFLDPEILIVPLVAFTRQGARLGYGGGFYDRTLAMLRARGPVLAVGFAYGAQTVQRLPEDPMDQRLDLIVTETEIIDPGA